MFAIQLAFVDFDFHGTICFFKTVYMLSGHKHCVVFLAKRQAGNAKGFIPGKLGDAL
jgi:hypothetical protein